MPSIRISEIDLEASVQVRAKIDLDTVTEYAAHIAAKKPPLPPIVLFGPDSRGKFFLSEGWHRLEAHRRAGRESIMATIRDGGWKEALEHALGSNAAHGLRRSNADKRRTVELAIKHWSGWSDQLVADKCGVSRNFVFEVRQEIHPVIGLQPDSTRTITGKDGKTYNLPPPPTRPPVEPQHVALEVPVRQLPPYVRPPFPPLEDPDQLPETEEGQLPKDIKGRVIPPICLPMWERRQEVLNLLSKVSEARCTIQNGQDDRDPLWCGKEMGRTRINFSNVIAMLNQAYADIKAALPERVCPVCQGLGCKHCHGLGVLSKYHLGFVPKELH